MNLYGMRSKIREAIWLWLFLTGYAKEGPDEWALVSEGNPISDEELAIAIGSSGRDG